MSMFITLLNNYKNIFGYFEKNTEVAASVVLTEVV